MVLSVFRYLDRSADSLQQKLIVLEKWVSFIEVIPDKRQATTIEWRDLEPKLEIIITKTKELQEQVRQQSYYFQ